MRYEVEISYCNSGIKETKRFRKDVETLYELKQAFLKRFGNINDAPNTALKEKVLVKKLTYEAESVSEWVRLINTHTRWELNII